LGVASEDLLKPMGSALLKMGMNRAIVVHGSGGLDEASLQGENKLVFVDNGELRFSEINISDFNQKNISNDKLVVSGSESNEEILKSVLNGSGQKSHINVVALNSALVLWAAGIENDLNEGFNYYHYERDDLSTCSRNLVFMTYLNDVEDGGTQFKYQNLITPAKKGLTLIWPTDFTHTHRGVISQTKEKYIVTGWYTYNKFDKWMNTT